MDEIQRKLPYAAEAEQSVLGSILIDAVLFAVLYRKTGNCLISFIPHFGGNMLGFFLVPVIFG